MKNVFPSGEEVFLMAHVERFCEHHRAHLVQPLNVRVTDAAGEVTEYKYYPEIDEDVNLLRISPEPPRLSLPVVLSLTDTIGTCVETCLTDLAPPTEGKSVICPEIGKV